MGDGYVILFQPQTGGSCDCWPNVYDSADEAEEHAAIERAESRKIGRTDRYTVYELREIRETS